MSARIRIAGKEATFSAGRWLCPASHAIEDALNALEGGTRDDDEPSYEPHPDAAAAERVRRTFGAEVLHVDPIDRSDADRLY